MMTTSLLQYILISTLALMLFSCAGGKPTGSAQKSQAPDLFDHKPAQDSVNWQAVIGKDKPPDIKHTALEWPGEQMGLIGPIVATGGRGSKRYVLVYDPAGVLVGGLTHKELNKNPERLVKLMLLAQQRAEVQNLYALMYMAARKIHTQTAAAAEKGAP